MKLLVWWTCGDPGESGMPGESMEAPSPFPFLVLCIYIEKDQSRLFGHLKIQFGVIVSHAVISSAMWWQVMGCMQMPLGGAWNAQNHKSGHLDKTLSGHRYEWDLCPLWALRTQTSNHPIFKLGCTPGHAWNPARLPLYQTHVTTAAAWLEADGGLSRCGCNQWQGLCAGHSLCSLLSCKLPPLCMNLRVTLLAY